MAFEYGCFISHVHATKPLLSEFVTGLKSALESELEAYVRDPVYIDEERLRPSYRWNEALARAMCKSACWIVVYVPQYPLREYCMRELQAMRVLEHRRRQQLGDDLAAEKGMIVPVVLRGRPDDLPDSLAEGVHYLDFSRFTTASGEILRSDVYMEQIVELAKDIHEIFELGAALDDDCTEFSIPRLDGDLGFQPHRQAFPGIGGRGRDR